MSDHDTCGFCGSALTERSHSLYFCSPEHQYRWMEDQAGQTQARRITHQAPPPSLGQRWSLETVRNIEWALWLANTDDMAEQRAAVRQHCGRGVLFEATGRASMHEAAPELEKWLDDNNEWEIPHDGVVYG